MCSVLLPLQHCCGYVNTICQQEKLQLQQILEQQQAELQQVCVCVPEFSTVHIIYLYTQYSCSVQSYEVQLSNLATALAKLERTVRKEKEEKVE